MIERVTVGAADLGKPNPTGPNDAALAAKEDKATTPQSDSQRPAWLPEKFKSAEDMAAAYKELETKQGAAKDPKDAPKDEAPPADAAEAVKAAGLDYDALGREVTEKGDISAEARAALVAKGITPEQIDGHINGIKASIDLAVKTAHDAVGGADAFKTMSEWLGTEGDDTQLHTYNALVQKGDAKSIDAAMKYLKGAYEAANGTRAAKRVEGSANGAPSNDAYTSRAQITQDMKDPRYKKDPAFRAQVEAKVQRSSVL